MANLENHQNILILKAAIRINNTPIQLKICTENSKKVSGRNLSSVHQEWILVIGEKRWDYLVVLLKSGVLVGEGLPRGVRVVGGGAVCVGLLGVVLPDVLPALLEVPPLRAATLLPAAHQRSRSLFRGSGLAGRERLCGRWGRKNLGVGLGLVE